jgi:hypothetical protein
MTKLRITVFKDQLNLQKDITKTASQRGISRGKASELVSPIEFIQSINLSDKFDFKNKDKIAQTMCNDIAPGRGVNYEFI